MDTQQKYAYWHKNVTKQEQALLSQLSKNEINEAFFKELEFGTAGIRGIVGLGTNRINRYAIIKTTQGIADYLLGQKSSNRVCICYDNRANSKEFALLAARVFAQNNIQPILTKSLAPTPYLSYAINHFSADAGVMITASHNTKEYNGYKVYNSEGCQLTDKAASHLKTFIDKVDPFTITLNKKLDEKIVFLSAKSYYLSKIKQFLSDFCVDCSQLKVVYTPLNGTGAPFVLPILRYLKINPTIVSEQAQPDAQFSTCPIPNPENEAAFDLAKKYAQKSNADIIIATDPDADRAGVMVKTADGYVRLTGNDVGVLLADFLLRTTKIPNPIIIRSVVSTPLVDKIAAKHGASVRKVLTGFKYIGEQLCAMKNNGSLSQFLLGFEDSAGYVASDYCKDKDGVLACALICLMAAECKNSAKTLQDRLAQLHSEYGSCTCKTLAFKFEGSSGSAKIAAIMKKLRSDALNSPLLKNAQIIDFLCPNNPISADNNLPPTNMLALKLCDCTLYIRPSGTEPLLKIYIFILGSSHSLNSIQNEINQLLQGE